MIKKYIIVEWKNKVEFINLLNVRSVEAKDKDRKIYIDDNGPFYFKSKKDYDTFLSWLLNGKNSIVLKLIDENALIFKVKGVIERK